MVKLAIDYIGPALTNLINNSLEYAIFPENAKKATVTPLDKGGTNKNVISNFRPVSILNSFSKIFEQVLKKQLCGHFDECLSIFIAAYRKQYSTQHVLLRLIEEWKENLDNDLFVGAILMDLSKAFDCIPHDLLIAKLAAYGFEKHSLELIYSYLTNHKQAVKINNTYSSFKCLLTGVPQGSILGPILFNIFLNDLFLFVKTATLHNYADDNTLSAFAKNIPDVIKVLEKETEISLDWLKLII